MNFRRISAMEAKDWMADARAGRLSVLDVRDEESFRAGCLPGALHLHGGNLESLLEGLDPDEPVLVYCYHGHMSQGVAARLAQQGFTQVASLDGGYEGWQD